MPPPPLPPLPSTTAPTTIPPLKVIHESSGSSLNTGPLSGRMSRLLVVANRLPFTVRLEKKAHTQTTTNQTPNTQSNTQLQPSTIPSPKLVDPNLSSPPPLASALPTSPTSTTPYLQAFAAAVAQQAQASHHQQHHGPGHHQHQHHTNLHHQHAHGQAHSHPHHHHHPSQLPHSPPTNPPSKKEVMTTEVTISPSPGGLVSALRGVSMPMHWIGWTGSTVTLGRKEKNLIKERLKDENCSPVFITHDVWDLYYNGFCNNLLWPLFHYIPLSVDALQNAEEQFHAYEEANILFAKELLKIYREGDVVWVHDYQLMLLPSLLRSIRPTMKIGFFLHTPFPSSEIYRVLPARKQLLLGVLASDLIGFHTHDYCRHFQSACSRILGATCLGDIIRLNGLQSSLGTFPIGIEPQRFLKALETSGVQHLVRELKTKFGNRRVLLGIDRLDYVKGILHKLYSYEKFFEQHPEWIGKVVLIQIAVPSRTDVPEYQKLRDKAHELVGKINGRFGNLLVVPVHYLDCSLSFDHMVSLYRIADATLITSIRDGMNLVAYEYIACQQNRGGVLILSEFAGAAQSLGAGAIQVNPWSFQELADAIHQALCMTEDERMERNAYVFKHVMTHTAQAWSKAFVTSLEQALAQRPDFPIGRRGEELHPLGAGAAPPPLLQLQQQEAVISAFGHSKKRLIVLGLAGTLSSDWFIKPVMHPPITPQTSDEAATSFSLPPSSTHPLLSPSSPTSLNDSHSGGVPLKHHAHNSLSPSMEAVISSLANDPSTTIVILTSRSRFILDEVLGKHPSLWLSAENGFFLRKGKSIGNVIHMEASAAPVVGLHSHPNILDPTGHPFTHTHALPSDADIGRDLPSIPVPIQPHPWQILYENLDLSWKEGVARVFEYFTERTPHTFIADSETMMSWHYRDAEPIFARRQVNDLTTHLTGGPLSNTATEVLDNSGVVQVRPLGISKGTALRHILQLLARKHRGYVKKRLARARKLMEDERAAQSLDESNSFHGSGSLVHTPRQTGDGNESGGEDDGTVGDYEESTPMTQRFSSPKRLGERRKSGRRSSTTAVLAHQKGLKGYSSAAAVLSSTPSSMATTPIMSTSELHAAAAAQDSDPFANPHSLPNASTAPVTPSLLQQETSFQDTFSRLAPPTNSHLNPFHLSKRRGSWSATSNNPNHMVLDRGNIHHLHTAHLHSHQQAQRYAHAAASGSPNEGEGEEEEDEFLSGHWSTGAGMVPSTAATASSNHHHRSHHNPHAVVSSSSTNESIEEIIAAGGFDFVLCLGNFLERDEDVFTLLNPVMDRSCAIAVQTGMVNAPLIHTASPHPRHHSPTLSSTQSSKTASPHFSFRRLKHGHTHQGQQSQQLTPHQTTLEELTSRELQLGAVGSDSSHSRTILGVREVPSPAMSLFIPSPPGPDGSPAAASSGPDSLMSVNGSSLLDSTSSSHLPSWSSLNIHTHVTPVSRFGSNLFGHSQYVHDQLAEFVQDEAHSPPNQGTSGGNHGTKVELGSPAPASTTPSNAPTSSTAAPSPGPSVPPTPISPSLLLTIPPTLHTPFILTCAVGLNPSKARFHLPDRDAVETLLTQMAHRLTQQKHQQWSEGGETIGYVDGSTTPSFDSSTSTGPGSTLLPGFTPPMPPPSRSLFDHSLYSTSSSHTHPLTPLLEARDSSTNIPTIVPNDTTTI